jgi:NADPH2:quinone reductase
MEWRLTCWSRFEGNFEILKRKGTFVSVGKASGAIPPFSPLKLSAKNLKFCVPTYVRMYVKSFAFTH